MEIFTLPKRVSWTTKLEDMEVGDKLKVDYNTGRSTVAPRISGKIKDKYPHRKYPTDGESEPGIMIIERTA